MSTSGSDHSGTESESDIEMKTQLPKKITKKLPKSYSREIVEDTPKEKKITTKEMIHEALEVLKSRKGVSLYAIKKYMVEKWTVDMAKINYHIKKNIKLGLENGSILQVKGVGVTGSFKLAPVKQKKPKPKITKEKSKEQPKKIKLPKTQEKTVPTESAMKKIPIKKIEKTKPQKKKEKIQKASNNEVKKDAKGKKKNETKVVTEKKGQKELKPPKMAKDKNLAKVVKQSKAKLTPSKKKVVMMKRKSIGSIIKPPKMKPKA